MTLLFALLLAGFTPPANDLPTNYCVTYVLPTSGNGSETRFFCLMHPPQVEVHDPAVFLDEQPLTAMAISQ